MAGALDAPEALHVDVHELARVASLVAPRGLLWRLVPESPAPVAAKNPRHRRARQLERIGDLGAGHLKRAKGKDRPDAPVRARPLRDAPNIKQRMGNEFYLGELWYNLTEEELFGD